MNALVLRALLLLAGMYVAAIGDTKECIDRSHFNYKCVELAKYCHMPQAKRIRSSCPVTCGMCAKDSLNVQPAVIADFATFGQSLDPRAPIRRKSIHFDDAGISEPRTLPGGGRIISVEERFKLLSMRRDPFGRLKKYTTTTASRTTSYTTLETKTTTANTATTATETTVSVSQKEPPSALGSSFSVGQSMHALSSGGAVQNDLLSLGKQLELPQKDLEVYLKQCCAESLMSINCRSICSYRVTAAEIFEKVVSATCTVQDASIWMRCASGGKKNTECCKKSNVIDCDNLCSGVFNVTEMMTCTHKHIRPILKCHEESLSQ